MRLVIGILALFLFSAPGFAFSAKQLKTVCDADAYEGSRPGFSSGVCSGFIEGVREAWEATYFCPPHDMPIVEIVPMVVGYLNREIVRDARALGEQAAIHVMLALREKYPCDASGVDKIINDNIIRRIIKERENR